MDEKHKKLVLEWMEASVTWWLDDAIKLMFGYDPKADLKQLALEGNDILIRANVFARQAIAEGILKPLQETTREDGKNDILLRRDNFVEWAKKEFRADGGEFHEVWRAYKKQSKFREQTQLEKHQAYYQAKLDDLYIAHFEKTAGRVAKKKDLCAQIKTTSNHSADTIPRYTSARKRNWILREIERRSIS